jgi:hypothetical protein
LKTCVPILKAPKYRTQKLPEMKRETDKLLTIGGEFNLLSAINSNDCFSGQTIHQQVERITEQN